MDEGCVREASTFDALQWLSRKLGKDVMANLDTLLFLQSKNLEFSNTFSSIKIQQFYSFVFFSVSINFLTDTLPETNIAPENGLLEY